eukprot:Lankesteria_metandrocarpae@DN8161_c0_g1_i1.p1
MAHLHTPIVLLKEGTDTSQGKGQILSNIGACQTVVDIVRTTLGPRGMDKLIHSPNSVTITNDGATVLQLLDVVHPAAKLLVDIAQAQDEEVGDGTTSVTLLAGELLSEARTFIEDGIHPQTVAQGYLMASNFAMQRLEKVEVNLALKSDAERLELLKKCAETTLNSKLVSTYKTYFADLVVRAVGMLDESLDKDLIGIKKITGGSVTDSQLISGVAFKKTFSYAGFEQQPKKFTNPKILLLNLELELKAEKENAEIRVSSPEEYQAVVDAEWKIIFDKLAKIADCGAQVVFSRLPVGDLATQYFAERGIFCAGRVDEADLKRTSRATNAHVQTTVNHLQEESLGMCGEFEEVQIGNDRYNILRDCKATKSATLILRGGAQQFIDEAERSLNDAIMIVRRAMKSLTIVGGGGSIEMLLSASLREYSQTIQGKHQLVIAAFARALECIPRTLSSNSGLDTTDIMTKLRQKHATINTGSGPAEWWGVDCMKGDICNTVEEFIWEPAVVKKNAISAAAEAACVILGVDETVKNPKSNPDPVDPIQRAAGRGMRR